MRWWWSETVRYRIFTRRWRGCSPLGWCTPTTNPHTAGGILESIEQSALLFDTLAAEWSASYQAHLQPLVPAIAA
ncbi:MAG: hypothetical protein ACRDJN_19210, partial [Chloroflexota bacterium]